MAGRARFLLAVPAYRESHRLPKFLPRLVDSVAKEFRNAKVVFVDDGSGAAEKSAVLPILRRIRSRHPQTFDFLFLPNLRGKGGAVLAAWRSALPRFDYLGFVDADGAFEPTEVIRLAKQLKKGGHGPALFASRVKMLGHQVDRKLVRHYLGRIFATWVGAFVEPGIYDSQCGLKFIPAAVFEKISPRLRGRRFAWDVELLGALLEAACPIREVPVSWRHIPGSRVRFLRDGIHLLWTAFREGRRLRQSRHQR